MNEQPKCPSCDSAELELRTDNHVMCADCGYIFPEPVDALGPDDKTPVTAFPEPDDWADTEPLDVREEKRDDEHE